MTHSNMYNCQKCSLTYDWRRSPSSFLKMTYCSSLCERSHLGFTIEALLRSESPTRKREQAAAADRELVAV